MEAPGDFEEGELKKLDRKRKVWGTVVHKGGRVKSSRLGGCSDTHLESQDPEGRAGQDYIARAT